MTGSYTPGTSVGNSPACSIIIRAYNEEQHIGRLLEGIQRQCVSSTEIILVDSGSTDATRAIAARYPVKIVPINPQEFTFGRSLNLGITAATADLIVIASAHVYPVYPDWIERLLEPFSDPQVGLVYGKQRGGPQTQFSEHQIFARWFGEQTILRQDHPFCNNANAAIRRSLWEQQPYDETLAGLEDLAWAHWLREHGHGIAYVAEAEIIHVHEETPRGVYNRYRREAMTFKHLFPQERFGLDHFLRLTGTNIISDLWHALRQGRLRAAIPSVFWFRWMQFWGTYQGYRRSGPLTWQLRQTFYYPQGINFPSQSLPRQVTPIRYNQE